MEIFDVAVVGGGPAGSTCAAFCTTNGLRTLLIEREKFPREKVCGDCLNPQYWPALRIQAIAAHFLARKFFAFNQERAQSVGRAKGRAGRARRSAPDDRHIENFHLVSVSRNKRIVKAISPVRFRRKLIRL